MKRFFCLCLLLTAISHFTMAQTKAQNERIKVIRTQFQEAMSRAERDSEESEYTDNSVHLQLNRMFGGSGMQHYKIDMYIEDREEDETTMNWQPYFFRFRYNWAAREIVHECLMNPENGKPIFLFVKMPDEDGTYEDRIYFNTDGTLCYASQTKYKIEDGTKEYVKAMKATDESVKNAISEFNKMKKWAGITLKL